MKFKLPWQKRSKKNKMIALEEKLSSALKSVEPRAEFVQQLRSQLVGEPKKKRFGFTPAKLQSGLLVFGGVVSAVLMVMAGFRALVTLLGTLGIIGQVKKQIDDSAPALKIR